MLDIFKGDAFSVISLTDAINKIPYVPTGLAGLFQTTSVSTLSIAIEERQGVLTLVPPSPRGGPGGTIDKQKRSAFDLRIPHFQRDDTIMADEVQGIRAWGQESVVETVMGKVRDRLLEHSQDFEATSEFHRIGAVKGVVTYADSTTLDLFDAFSVSQEGEVDFDLDNANPATGALRAKCDDVWRIMTTNLGGIPFSGIRAEVGDTFWNNLMAHKEIRETHMNWDQAVALRQGTAYGEYPFGGITFRNYRGSVGGSAFVHTDKAHLYPVGVPGLFRCYYAPADYIETVNTPGQRLYVKQYQMPNDKGINFELQMNALHICTRPRSLIKGKRT